MTRLQAKSLVWRMSAGRGGRRVVIAVQPSLLAETLRRLLLRPGVDVVLAEHLDDPVEADVAIVMEDGHSDVNAEVVIRIPEPAAAGGSITTPHGTQPAQVGDLVVLLEAVNRVVLS